MNVQLSSLFVFLSLWAPARVEEPAPGRETPNQAKLSKEDAAKKDLKQLQGKWVMVSCERDGEKLSEEEISTYRRTIKGNKYTVTFKAGDGTHELHGTITLDPTKRPKAIDAIRTEGESKGQPMLGIYELGGKTQKVCFAPVGQDRPTEFSSKAGTQHVLTVWKRADGQRPVGPKGAGGRDAGPGRNPDKTGEAASVGALRRIVDDCNRRAIEAFKKGDMLAVARGYADDATIYFPRGKSVRGREAIDRYWQGVKGAKDWKLETIEVGGTREAIYEVGKSTLTTEVGGKEHTYVCDYVVIWKREIDGSYRTHIDIFN
jgi:uncharacterized protein (TIGR03067 family)